MNQLDIKYVRVVYSVFLSILISMGSSMCAIRFGEWLMCLKIEENENIIKLKERIRIIIKKCYVFEMMWLIGFWLKIFSHFHTHNTFGLNEVGTNRHSTKMKCLSSKVAIESPLISCIMQTTSDLRLCKKYSDYLNQIDLFCGF